MVWARAGPNDRAMTIRIRLRGPGDIISVLPYHLGYHPSDSLVLVCLKGNQFAFVARVDLPPPGLASSVVEELLPHVVREAPDEVVILGFESEPGQAEPASVTVRDALLGAGIPVANRLLVRGRRWWSLDCDAACCPAEGEPVPEDDDVPAIADYVLLGRRPAASRADLDLRLEPVDDGGVRARRCARLLADLTAACRSGGPRRQRVRRRALEHWGSLLDVSDDETYLAQQFTDEDWARLAVSLRDVDLRDLIVAWLCPGSLDLDLLDPVLVELAGRHLPPSGGGPGRSDVEWTREKDRVVERLAALCRHTPPELSPGPLTVLANLTWWLGNGAMTRIALDRAIAADPQYRLAVLLDRAVDLAIRPSRTA